MRPSVTLRFSGAVAVVLACGTALVRPAEPAATNAPANQVLMNDDFGKLVVVPTNKLSSQLRPPSGISITNQIPSPTPGTPIPALVQEREQNQRAGQEQLQFFPPFSPPLASYLASVDQFGNTALKPGALIPVGAQRCPASTRQILGLGNRTALFPPANRSLTST